MKINRRLFKKSALTIAAVAVIGFGVSSCADLWGEVHPGTYYTNNGGVPWQLQALHHDS